MGAGHWTVQVMPEDSGPVRTWRLPRRLVRGVRVVAGAAILISLALIANLIFGARREVELLRLRSENRHLEANLTRIESQVATLSRSVDAMSAKDQSFRLLAGLSHIDPEIRAVGVGGPETPNREQEEFFRAAPGAASEVFSVSYDVDKLIRRANLLSSSLTEALDSVAERRNAFLALPSIRPVQDHEAWISSSFSRSRFHPILLYNRPHEGIDIAAHAGTPILATASGRVAFVGRQPGYGKMIEIDHGNGFRTRYAHAAALHVKRGQRVERGDMIGEVGQTGLANAPNLHYEVLRNGRPVNPRDYLLDSKIFE